MTDLNTHWLGLALRSPVVIGASPLSDDLDSLRACVEAGAGAVVMHSLFEEQLIAEQMAAHRFIDSRINSDAEALSFFPESQMTSAGSRAYLKRLELLRASLEVPVIASLNGVSAGGWLDHASELEQAGASALELNLYDPAAVGGESAAQLEGRQLEVVAGVVERVAIPVTVKLSPFYSALPALVAAIDDAGAAGVAVFNRFYQPDIDLDELALRRDIVLSTSAELPQRLHAIAQLHGHTRLELAATGGVHSGDDAVKAILCGAAVVQVVSAVLARGPLAVAEILDGLATRLAAMGYLSVHQARGALSLLNAPDPHTWERLNYARLLQGWRPRN